MQKIFIVFLVGFIFFGCSQKAAVIKQSGIEEQALVDSRTIQLTQGKEILAFVVITYLNLVDKQYRNDNLDKFVIGIYAPQKHSNTTEKIKFTLHNNVPKPIEGVVDYSHMNDNNVTNIAEIDNENLLPKNALTTVKALDINDSILQIIPSSNIWNKYFLVSTKSELAKSITLSIDSTGGEFGAKKVTFTKRYF